MWLGRFQCRLRFVTMWRRPVPGNSGGLCTGGDDSVGAGGGGICRMFAVFVDLMLGVAIAFAQMCVPLPDALSFSQGAGAFA